MSNVASGKRTSTFAAAAIRTSCPFSGRRFATTYFPGARLGGRVWNNLMSSPFSRRIFRDGTLLEAGRRRARVGDDQVRAGIGGALQRDLNKRLVRVDFAAVADT
jgi:hypothetical protein